MKKLLFIIIIILIVAVPVGAIEVYDITLKIDIVYEGDILSPTKVDYLVELSSLFTNDWNYLTDEDVDETTPYVFRADITDKRNQILSTTYFKPSFIIWGQQTNILSGTLTNIYLKYLPEAKYLKIYNGDVNGLTGLNKDQLEQREKLAVELKDNLCNNNNVCDNYESYYSCPNDCNICSKDSICTSNSGDGCCDSDCYSDKDCEALDSDNDRVIDSEDNCPDVASPDQKNTDLEMAGGTTTEQAAETEPTLILHDNFDDTTLATTAGTEFVEGKQGKGILIDSTDTADYNKNLNLQKGTIEYWIKPLWDVNTDKADRKILLIGDLTNGLIVTGKSSMGKDASTYLEIFVNGEDKILPFVIGENGQNWKQNQWYHVAWSWDSTTGEMKAYLNGNLVNNYKYKPFTININSNKLQLGYAWGNAINSVIDELKIYKVVRTANEIKKDMLISTEPVPETKLPTEPVLLVEEPITTTTIEMIGDEFGDACDEDDDNDGTLDENDLCEKTYPSANMILSVGCSCEQILSYKPNDNFVKEINNKEPGIYGRCTALVKGAEGKGLTAEKTTGKSVFGNILGFVVRLFR